MFRWNALLLFFCIVFLPVAYAEKKITANALFDGKAVLIINGEAMFFSAGETRQGVKLVEANEHRAVIEWDGRRQTLQLDKGIAEEYAERTGNKSDLTSLSHVISAVLIHQTSNIATFEVEYFYNKTPGERANLSAKTMRRNELTDYWMHTHTPLTAGRNITTITVGINGKAPERYDSDAIRFDMNWIKDGKAGVTGTLVIPFIKTWKQ